MFGACGRRIGVSPLSALRMPLPFVLVVFLLFAPHHAVAQKCRGEYCCAGAFYRSEPGRWGCQWCPAGKYQPETNCGHECVSECSCLDCPAGHHSTAESLSAKFTTLTDACRECPRGYFSGVGSSECTPCPVGNFTAQGGQGACSSCPKGHFANYEATYECTKCKAGTFNAYNGSSTADSCVPCESGTFSDQDGASTCTLCAPGTYNMRTGNTVCN